MKEINVDAYQLGQRYFDEGFQETGKMIFDESEYRTALLVGLVAKTAVLAAGAPGGGKTILGSNLWRIIEGAREEDFAIIPPDSNLTEKELVGGVISSTRYLEKEDDGSLSTWKEKSDTVVDPIITPKTLGIFIDELTRISPWAVNSLLGAPEEYRVKTNAGYIDLPRFQIMISTMNPNEVRDATFPVGLALASRHAVGAIIGNDISTESKAKLQDDELPDISTVKPFVKLEELDLLRDTVSTIKLPRSNIESRVKRVDTAEYLLNKHLRGMAEKGRMHQQVGRVARILALFDGTGQVNNAHFNQAIRFAMASRIGALHDDIEDAPRMLNELHRLVMEKT